MARLPSVGGDDGNWGTLLNDFLAQEHNADGTQKDLPQSKITNLTTDLAGKAAVNNPAFTGSVILPGDPASRLQAATKQYVDNNNGTVLHAGLVDTATNGHPANVVSTDPTGLTHVQATSTTLPATLNDMDAAISAAYQHANLTDIATNGHPASVIAVDKSSFTHITTANSQLQEALNSIDTQIGATAANVFARKTSDQSVTSSTSFVNDTQLACSVLASGIYVVIGSIIIDGSTIGDFKQQFTAPSGTTFDWSSYGQGVGASSAIGSVDQAARTLASPVSHGMIGAGTNLVIRIQGLLVVSSTAGTFQYRWAQNTSDTTATIVHSGSFLLLQKVN